MQDISQYEAVWGKLARFDLVKIDRLAIPTAAKEFLCNVGLPNEAHVPPGVKFTASADDVVTDERGGLVVGLLDDHPSVCVDPSGVVVIEGRFVNSNLECFVGSLYALELSYGKDDGITWLRRELPEIDKRVFEDEANYWPTALQDAELLDFK